MTECFGAGSSLSSFAAIADGKAVFVTSRGVHVVCTDLKTGKLLWTTPQDHGGYFACMAGPSIFKGKVYVPGGSFVRAFDLSTGELLWRKVVKDESHENFIYAPVTIAGDYLYFGTQGGDFVCMDVKDGSIKWQYEIGAKIQSSPAVSGNSIYLTTRDGTVLLHICTVNRMSI